MSAQLEIIWTDRGGGTGGAPAPMRTPGSAQPAERTPGPGDTVSGPKKRSDAAAGADFEAAAQKIANVLGGGGLVGTAVELRRAFVKLFDAVNDSSRAIKGARRADVSGERTGEIKGPSASPSVAAAETPAVPSVGTFERQRAKGEIEAPPVTRAVSGPVPSVGWYEKTVAAKGTATAPPVLAGPSAAAARGATAAATAGPAAGGSAAGGMAALSAAAGPLAIAFAATTAAVVAGGVAVKRFADAMQSEAERLSGYSADLAGATARSGIREELADLRRAQQVGPGLAKFENMRSNAETAVTDAITVLMDEVLQRIDKFEPLIEVGTDSIRATAKVIPAVLKFIEYSSPLLLAMSKTSDYAEDIAKILRWWFDLGEAEKDDEFGDPFMDAFLNRFGGPKLAKPIVVPGPGLGP